MKSNLPITFLGDSKFMKLKKYDILRINEKFLDLNLADFYCKYGLI